MSNEKLSGKRRWIMVKPHNAVALNAVYDEGHTNPYRLGDQLRVDDRSRLAACLRYWRIMNGRRKTPNPNYVKHED